MLHTGSGCNLAVWTYEACLSVDRIWRHHLANTSALYKNLDMWIYCCHPDDAASFTLCMQSIYVEHYKLSRFAIWFGDPELGSLTATRGLSYLIGWRHNNSNFSSLVPKFRFNGSKSHCSKTKQELFETNLQDCLFNAKLNEHRLGLGKSWVSRMLEIWNMSMSLIFKTHAHVLQFIVTLPSRKLRENVRILNAPSSHLPHYLAQ